ncbi:MAG: glycosyltransferase, partial [Terriglobia bacterium]
LQRAVPRFCAENCIDALLCLGNFAPHRSPCPTAVLIQNAYLAYREPVAERRLTFRERLILAYGRSALRALRNRRDVVVQTAIMRERLLSLQPFDPEKISVITNPLDCADSGLKAVVRSDRESRPFTFLCLTRYYAHKNLEILPEALKLVLARTSQQVRCLITISANQHPRARKLLDRIKREGLSHVLTNMGPVPNCRLAHTFASADALVLPTLLESHTRTYSEAMKWGLPVLTSGRDFARGLCGEAALYFDPLDPESVANAMLAIMADQDLRLKLVNAGRRVVAGLPSWDVIAAQFVAVLERTAEGKPARTDPLCVA